MNMFLTLYSLVAIFMFGLDVFQFKTKMGNLPFKDFMYSILIGVFWPIFIVYEFIVIIQTVKEALRK